MIFFCYIFRFKYLAWGQLLQIVLWRKDIVAVMILVYGENLPVKVQSSSWG